MRQLTHIQHSALLRTSTYAYGKHDIRRIAAFNLRHDVVYSLLGVTEMVSCLHSIAGRSLVQLLWPSAVAVALFTCIVPAAAQPSEIQAADEYLQFVRAIAVQTALAETSGSDVVKLLLLGSRDNGEVVVLKLGLLTGNAHAQTDDFSSGLKVAVIVHVHHSRMTQAPVADDSFTVRHFGVPNIVISSDGRQLWEVGVVADRDVYREIGASQVGRWLPIE